MINFFFNFYDDRVFFLGLMFVKTKKLYSLLSMGNPIDFVEIGKNKKIIVENYLTLMI